MGLIAVVSLVMNLRRPGRIPMESQRSWPASILGIAGFLCSLGGMWMLVKDNGDQQLGLKLFFGGLAAAVVSIAINSLTARARRDSWPNVRARCAERNLQRQHHKRAARWTWKLVCDLNFEGKSYRVTPKAGWSDIAQCETSFPSEEKARAWLEKMISPDGGCTIRINPKNPQDAELLPLPEYQLF